MEEGVGMEARESVGVGEREGKLLVGASEGVSEEEELKVGVVLTVEV